MYKKTEKKEGKCSATQGLFPFPYMVTLMMGLGATYLFYYSYPFGKPWVPSHLRRCYTKIPHTKSDLCTGINEQGEGGIFKERGCEGRGGRGGGSKIVGRMIV